MRPRFKPAALTLCMILGACTTLEKDPYRVTTGDLIFGWDRLKSYLVQRRQENEALLQRTQMLEQQVQQQQAILRGFDQEIVDARRAHKLEEAAAQQLRAEIEKKNVELRVLNDRLIRLKAEVETSKKDLSATELNPQERLSIDSQLADQKREIAELEEKKGFMQNMIERSIRTRINLHLNEKL